MLMLTRTKEIMDNVGQPKKLLPEWLQEYPGCHGNFTGPGHSEPPPLP